MFQITACRKNDIDDNDDNGNEGHTSEPGSTRGTDDFDIEELIYLPHEIDMGFLGRNYNQVNCAMAYKDFIVCWYVEFRDIVIIKITPDGETKHEMRFAGPDDLHGVWGLRITDDGHYIFIVTTFDTQDNLTFIYIIFEEFNAFTGGLRSSSDAARIIQNRVQRYLDEQG